MSDCSEKNRPARLFDIFYGKACGYIRDETNSHYKPPLVGG
jgi:hypothetical protein